MLGAREAAAPASPFEVCSYACGSRGKTDRKLSETTVGFENSLDRGPGLDVNPEIIRRGKNTNEVSGEEDEALLVRLLRLLGSDLEASARAEFLLQRYGSLERLARIAQAELCDDEILSPGEIAILRTVQAFAANVLRVRAIEGSQCGNFEQLHAYLQMSLSGEQREVSRLIFLDGKNRIIKDEPHTTGTLNFTPYFPREIVKRVLFNNAAGLILVHNHPSGDPSPSIEDLSHTRELGLFLSHIGVSLLDHVIVGRHRTLSLRQLDATAFVGGSNE